LLKVMKLASKYAQVDVVSRLKEQRVKLEIALQVIETSEY